MAFAVGSPIARPQPVGPARPVRFQPVGPARPVRPVGGPARPVGSPLLGSFKEGGKVPATGAYKLHKDEVVIPKDKVKKMAKKSSKVEKVNLGKKGSFNVRKGALHRALGIPEGEKIGQSRIKKAERSKNPETRREAASAEGLTHMKK
jgi:hypothetical protein